MVTENIEIIIEILVTNENIPEVFMGEVEVAIKT